METERNEFRLVQPAARHKCQRVDWGPIPGEASGVLAADRFSSEGVRIRRRSETALSQKKRTLQGNIAKERRLLDGDGQALTRDGRDVWVELAKAIGYTAGLTMGSYSTHGDVVFRWLVTGRLRTLRAACWPDSLL